MNEAITAKIESGVKKEEAVRHVVVDTLTKHYRVLFNGDGYSPEWVKEAATRGLQNFRTTPKALLGANMEEIYVRTAVMTSAEVDARRNVQLENYVKAKTIEGRCLTQMASKYFVPAGQMALARMGAGQAVAAVPEVAASIQRLSSLLSTVLGQQAALKKQLKHTGDLAEEATFIDDVMCGTMERLREAADEMEDLCTPCEWNLPTYHEMLLIQCP